MCELHSHIRECISPVMMKRSEREPKTFETSFKNKILPFKKSTIKVEGTRGTTLKINE
jgi:hypothetical protein